MPRRDPAAHPRRTPARGTTGRPRHPRDRAARRDRRRAGIALAVVLPALVAGGCGPATSRPAAAEVVDSGPDCLAEDVLWALGIAVPDGYDRPGPTAGTVPADFEPVAVVECRGPLSGPVELLPEPQPFQTAPVVPGDLLPDEVGLTDAGGLVGLDGPVAGEPGATAAPDPAVPSEPVTVRVTEVELRGDLGALLAQLARPSQEPPPDTVCTAMWQSRPVIWLVDAAGHAVLASWPTDVCGYLLDDAVTAPLAALDPVSEQVRTAGTR